MSYQEKIFTFEATVLDPAIDSQKSNVFDFGSLFRTKKATTKAVLKGQWMTSPKYGPTYAIKFSAKDSHGGEHLCSFWNRNVELNEGDEITFICSTKTGYPLRLLNRTTGQFWAAGYNTGITPRGKFGKLAALKWVLITSYFSALFRAIPIINIFDVLLSFFWVKKQQISASLKTKALLFIALFFYLSSYVLLVEGPMGIYEPEPATTTEESLVEASSIETETAETTAPEEARTAKPTEVVVEKNAAAKLAEFGMSATMQYINIVIEGPKELAKLAAEETIIPKNEMLHFLLWPLQAFTGDFRIYRDLEKNQEFLDFYHGDSYNHANDFGHLKVALLVWYGILTFGGFLFHGAFLTALRREQILKQIFLNELAAKMVAEAKEKLDAAKNKPIEERTAIEVLEGQASTIQESEVAASEEE